MIKMFILYVFETDRSGILLAEALKFPHGNTPPKKGGYLLVRWGSSKSPEIEERFRVVINPAKAVREASLKIQTMPLLREEGVRIPDFSTSYKELWEQGIRTLVGQTARHTEGRGFLYYNNIPPEKLKEERDYYLKYIEGEEFRVLRAFNEFLLYRRVPRRSGAVNPHCRSSKDGWILRRVSPKERWKDVWEQAMKACKVVGLQIAGVDVRLHDGKAYILEINTGPRLNVFRAEFLRKQIMRNV